jgi:voltage-gated potassium channel
MNSTADSNLRRERWKLTARLVRVLETPMLLLSGVWTLLVILEFTRGLSPALQTLNDFIWAAFIVQFAVEFLAAPSKRVYLRKRWLTAVSLALPCSAPSSRFMPIREVLRTGSAQPGAGARSPNRQQCD